MNRALLVLFGLAAILIASPAAALNSGIAITWNQCELNAAAASDLTSPCNDDGAVYTCIGSFVPPGIAAGDTISLLVSEESYVDLVTNSADLPDWWHLETGGCRDGSIVASAAKGGGQSGCRDYWGTSASGGFIYQTNYPTASYFPLPNSARFSQVWARTLTGAAGVTNLSEYYAFRIDIFGSHTTAADPPACAGCNVQVCIVFNTLLLQQPVGTPGGQKTLTTPTSPGKNIITWQGAGANCAAVPARRTSWGQVKSLYR